jgi:hypothetical protein
LLKSFSIHGEIGAGFSVFWAGAQSVLVNAGSARACIEQVIEPGVGFVHKKLYININM